MNVYLTFVEGKLPSKQIIFFFAVLVLIMSINKHSTLNNYFNMLKITKHLYTR